MTVPPASISIPTSLIEAIKSTRAIPFLGAGASKEAQDTDGNRPPNGDQLRDALALKFFGHAIPNRDLMTVAEMAIKSGHGQSIVFEEIRKIFSPFHVGDAHRSLPEFRWRAIATTNYDLLIEQAYSDSADRRQDLVRFVKDSEPVEAKLQETTKPVQYLKLHGCLDHLHDGDIPLILTKESYARYAKNRTRLFARVEDYAQESSLIFIGYRLEDPHIRNLIYSLDATKRPRWYMVTPDAEPYDVDYWATQNVGVLKATFGEFMAALQEAIPPLFRAFGPSASDAEQPIRSHYRGGVEESDEVRAALTKDLQYVHSGMPFAAQDPVLFYQGYDTGWGGIINRLDVRRKAEDDLLYKALLENEAPSGPKLILLRGAGGSGKTIAIKRTAIEAAASGALVLWLSEGGAIKGEIFAELHDLTQKTIYLFIDQIGFHNGSVVQLIRFAKDKSLPLVIVGAERDADWATYCSSIEHEIDVDFVKLGSLSQGEVEGLLDLLARADCLGLLKGMSREDQIKAFMAKNRADRQLLVALHELTQGRPFEKIVLEEHQRIFPDEAQSLHLDIATMHQFGVTARAGVISRISGILFEDFQTRFLQPLKNIVRVDRDPYSGDFVYRTRHPRVASIVFREVCPNDESKADQLIRIISGLDVGYSADKRALEEICRGRALAESFADIAIARLVYEAAVAAAPEQAFLLQQWALLEANHPDGSYAEAEKLAQRAHDIDPRNKTIIHTQAEIDRRRAVEEVSPLLKASLRRRARERLSSMPGGDRFAASSRCKLLVDEVVDFGRQADDSGAEADAVAYAEKIKSAEELIARAKQSFPDEPEIDQVEARLRTEVDQEDRALRALERAWKSGARGTGTAIRIARMYGAQGRSEEADKLLRDALGRYPDDKNAHYAMAVHLLRVGQGDPDFALIEEHLARSFSNGDRSFEPRFSLAQLYFVTKQLPKCVDLFEMIADQAPAEFRRVAPKTDNEFGRFLGRYNGHVTSTKGGFLFIRSSAYPTEIFSHRNSSDYDVFDDLSVGEEVNFSIRFNREGPTAVDLQPGRCEE